MVTMVPNPGAASVVHGYGTVSMDGWVRAKGFSVSAEALYSDNGGDPVGAPGPPEPGGPARFTGRSEICVTADSGLVTKGRVRKQVIERACPVRSNGFRYDAETFEASLVGTVRTKLWTRRWEVKGGRWVLVLDKTVKKKATLNLIWRWTDRPVLGLFEPCGSVGYSNGLSGPAHVRGSIRFGGIGIKATMPPGTPGRMFMGVCANPA
jgi:hypothetical protein